jgi:hypothetical protein
MAKEPDPRTELAALAASLKAASGLRCGYVLRGAERWYRQRAVELVLAAAQSQGLEICRHDARDPEFRLQGLADDLTSQAMFAAARCVVITEPEDLLKKTSTGAESGIARAAKSFVKSKRGTLVLVADALRADNATSKEIAAAGGVVHSFRRLYDRPSPWERDQDPRRSELCTWIVARAKELGTALTPERALLFAHAQGNDLAALDAQIASMANAGPNAPQLGLAAAGSPGEVADALILGELPRAMLAIETLYRGGVRKEKDGGRETSIEALNAILLGFLRPKLRQGLTAELARAAGASDADAQSAAGIGAFDRALRDSLGLRSAERWQAMLDDLLDVERRSRHGATLDASEWTRLALRWSRRPRAAASPARSAR